MTGLDLNSIYILWLRDMKRFIRSRIRLISNIVRPLLWLGIIGVGLGRGLTRTGFAGFSGYNFFSFLAPGIIAMAMLFSGMFSGITVLWDKRFGFMKEILVSPVSRLSLMFGKILGGGTLAIMQGLIILVFAGFLGMPISGIGGVLMAIIMMLLISFFFVALGLVFASQMEDPESFPGVVNFILMPMFLLSGAMFPVNSAPGVFRILALVNPLTYGVDGLRISILGKSFIPLPLWLDLGVLIILTTVSVLIGSYMLDRINI